MDVYRKFRPDATEKKLVLVGRLSTVVIVLISIAWIPMIRFFSNQIFQYLQAISAYVGAPISAVFLTGILWKRATARAAIITLITGGVFGLVRFITDILSKMGYTDFGPFNILTGYAFLNFALIMFLFCVILMVAVSFVTQRPRQEQIENLTFSHETMSAGVDRVWILVHIGLTILVAALAVSIWAYFA